MISDLLAYLLYIETERKKFIDLEKKCASELELRKQFNTLVTAYCVLPVGNIIDVLEEIEESKAA